MDTSYAYILYLIWTVLHISEVQSFLLPIYYSEDNL